METERFEMILQSMSTELQELQQRMAFFEAVMSQLLMGLSEAGVIQLEEDEQEDEDSTGSSSIIIP
jgi:hypothetical protein